MLIIHAITRQKDTINKFYVLSISCKRNQASSSNFHCKITFRTVLKKKFCCTHMITIVSKYLIILHLALQKVFFMKPVLQCFTTVTQMVACFYTIWLPVFAQSLEELPSLHPSLHPRTISIRKLYKKLLDFEKIQKTLVLTVQKMKRTFSKISERSCYF